MKPTIWGKYMWMSIHLIALGYPTNPTQEEKESYYAYFNDLYKVIPCVICSQNYVRHLSEIPLDDNVLKSRNNLFDWTVKLHNTVNEMLGKKVISREHAYNIFTSQILNQNDLITNAIHNLSSPSSHKKIYLVRKVCIIMNLLLLFCIIWLLYKYLLTNKFI